MTGLKGKKLLVTGGAGFVGSNIVERLIKEGAIVTVLDDLFTGKLSNLPSQDKFKFVEGSVCDFDVVKKLVSVADIIIHAAARNIIVSTKDPREDFNTNIGGTLNILLAARDTKVERIVYTSSCSVYGNPRYLPINEDDYLNLLTPYSVSKLGGENYCIAFYETYGLPTSVVRYSNIYGTKQDPANPYCGVISKFIDSIHRGGPPTVHGDGDQTRDFTFVDDAVEATLLCATSERAVGEIFNVGTGVETSVNQVARILLGLFKKEFVPVHTDRRDIDNIRRRVVNIEKTRKKLRWVPTVTLEEGLKRTKEWYEREQLRQTP
ncbi:MAG: GDP-mannose 4,6-dehydratase [Candidatus Eisenbacteria bacterium]|nr:GDP-mannose 4,6-dehydratase [Candidatus Eisenbacteria bacterium]